MEQSVTLEDKTITKQVRLIDEKDRTVFSLIETVLTKKEVQRLFL